MIDLNLVDSMAYLDGMDRLIESKSKEYLNPDKILDRLTINYQDLDKLMEQQAIQASEALAYGFIAAKMNSLCYMFEETIVNPYLAHCRKYASLYLSSQDRKDTKESLNDAITIIFSDKADKAFYSAACFDQSLEMKKDELLEHKTNNKNAYTANWIGFMKEMYAFPDSYEILIQKKAKLQYRKEMTETLVESYKQLSISILNIIKLKLMGSSVMPRNVIDAYTISRIRRLHSMNPGLTDDQMIKEFGTNG